MTRWLLMIVLCSCFVNASEIGAELLWGNVPPCTGVEHGYVTFSVAPNGKLHYFLADRPMIQVTGPANLTCHFEMNRKVHLESETKL